MVALTRKQTDLVFKAIADPTRREIIALLADRERTVGEIAGNFCSSRPAISKHLRVLQQAGLVTSRRAGTSNICRINPAPLSAVQQWVATYEMLWKEKLSNLKKYVEGTK